MRLLGFFSNDQARREFEGVEAMLFQDQAHAFGAVEKGMGWVVDVVPVGEVNVRSEEFGFDDQKAARIEELVEAGEFALRIMKMFGHFAAHDEIVGGV